jgi:RNA polymerase primary sigma factor
VRSLAARYRDIGLPFDDLVQEGSLGLLEAIDGYDAGRGTDFETYARFRVRRAIRNALTEKSRLIRLPKHRFSVPSSRLQSPSGRAGSGSTP